MRRTVIVGLLAIFLLPCRAPAQTSPPGASAEAQRANQHYQRGWAAMRAESWAEAAREFQQAIDNDPKFALAYYSLGRAHMGLREFAKAIADYKKCRDEYVAAGGERFTDRLAATRRLEDRILEYRTALNQATQGTSGPKSASQTQSLYIRELQAELQRLEDARQLNQNVAIDASVPFFVPMALGAAYFRNNQFADAEREYKTALEANPDSGETHNNLAVLYLMTDRPDAADREVKSAEKAGFHVHPQLKDDIAKRRKSGAN